MNLLRALAIGLFVWILFAMLRGYLKRRLPGTHLPGLKPAARIGTMVRCQQCGLHVPETEALRRDNQFYCSIAHRDGK